MALSKDQILSASDSKLQSVSVPEWGGDVYLRVMSGTERDSWEAAIMHEGKISTELFRAKLLVRTLCDEQGNRLFEDSETAMLSGKSGAVLSRLFDVAHKLNALSKADVDELTKN